MPPLSIHYFNRMKREKELEAILVIGAGLLVFYFIFKIELLVIISLGLIIISLASKFICSKIVWLWFKLSEVMGYVMSRILLTAIFFLFLYPISLLYRLFNDDNLNLKKGNRSSYFTDRNHQYEPRDLENPW